MATKLFQTMALMMAVGAALVSWAADGQPPAEGAALPTISLTAPKDAAHQAYLGLGGQKTFTIADIPAEVVIIHIFNMY
jgi:hypothetical protein